MLCRISGWGIAFILAAAPGWAADAGSGRPQAVQTLRSLADHGDIGAQFRIGRLYEAGDGVRQDVSEAARWYRMAAEQGNRPAQGALGRLLAGGGGVAGDPVLAHMWLSLATRPPVPAGDEHASLAALLTEVAARLAPDQRAEAERLARAWKPR